LEFRACYDEWVKHSLIAIIMTIILVLVPVIGIGAVNNDRPAEAKNVSQADQTITVPGQTITVPGPPVTVPGPRITIPGPRITIPGPTITIPGGVRTIEVPIPGPTRTVTVRTAPETVTIKPPPDTRSVTVPGPTETVSERETVTVSTSESGGRQEPSGSATLDSGNPGPTINLPDIDLSTPKGIALGTLTVMALAGLILLGLWTGYYMGYKDRVAHEAKDEVSFIKSLLNREKDRN
jgi:phage baseplate assembly protein gpV